MGWREEGSEEGREGAWQGGKRVCAGTELAHRQVRPTQGVKLLFENVKQLRTKRLAEVSRALHCKKRDVL